MAKTMFHTYDVFDIKDSKTRWKWFDICHNQALKCGLTCRCFIENPHFLKLELWGSKQQFIKYYFITLAKTERKLEGIKRLMSFIIE